MRGVGGPLLCIGDLLSDVGEQEETAVTPTILHNNNKNNSSLVSSDAAAFSDQHIQSSDLIKLYQDNYKRLNEALGGTGHSWTALTLELCSALETADKLVQSTNDRVSMLSYKILELERITKRSDAVIKTAKYIDNTTSHEGSLASQTADASTVS